MARKGPRLGFKERNPRFIGFIALALIGAMTALGLLLQGGLLTPSYEVTAMFTDGGGITTADRVTVAGLPAGRIADIDVREGQVAVTLAVERDVELPADSGAEVVIETFLGRRSVALVPGRSSEVLADGAVIPVERTVTPVDVTDLNDISVRLLNESDADAFEQFLSEVSTITEGQEDEIRALIQGLERVVVAVDSRRSELDRLLRSLRTIATTLGQRDQTIVSLIDNLDVVLANLAERQQDLERFLRSTASSTVEIADLVRRNRPLLDHALEALHADLQVLDRHQVDLAATITYLEQAVQGYSSVGYSQGRVRNRWANIFVQSLGPAGVDAIVGQCGVVDQLFDDLFGTDCAEGGGGGGGRRGGPDEGDDPPPDEGPGLPVPLDSEAALPCTIGDLVASAVGEPAPGSGEGGCEA